MSVALGTLNYSDLGQIRRYVDGAVVMKGCTLNTENAKFFALKKCNSDKKSAALTVFYRGLIVKKDGVEKFKKTDNRIYEAYHEDASLRDASNGLGTKYLLASLEGYILAASIISGPSEKSGKSYPDDPGGFLSGIAFDHRLKKDANDADIKGHREHITKRFKLEPEEMDQLINYQIFMNRLA